MRSTPTKSLTREEWLHLRKTGIGGSDAGAVCGVNPYKSPASVYADKISPDIQLEDNESMRQGRDFEDYVARRFTESTGLKVRRSNVMYQHDDYPWMLADIDRMVVGERSGLECKTASAFSYDRWKSIDSIPEHYIIQCAHYMSIMGWDHMYLACLILGRDFIYYRIDRDDELIKNLITIERNFWEGHVLKGILPDPDGSSDFDKLIGGNYFKTNKNSSIPLIGWDDQLRRRSDLNRLISKLETEKKEIDQQIKLFMAENEIAENEKYRITWKYSESTGQRRFIVKEAA